MPASVTASPARRLTPRPSLLHGLWSLLLPAACVRCGRAHDAPSSGIVCGVCLSQLVPLTVPLCERCGHPRLSPGLPLPAPREVAPGTAGPLPPCRWCPRVHPGVRAVRSAVRMDQGSGSDLVHALKYQGWSAAAEPMAARLARLSWPRDVREERAALVPIPLSRQRLRERGYNQAAELARALAPRWNLPVWEQVLVRTRHTASQVRLTPSERVGNVSQAFVVPEFRRSLLRGQHVVLVDDVITTSATLNAAAEALLAGGARIISCVTFGRAPDPGDRAVPDYDFIRN
ncbi:MAG: double zinc ribbon domain-containing protein [Gemmatimonadaceae bacterium]|nr:double zinc ribbon domain-containing protein [Gemmatimonadaceae bacterium]